MEALVSQVIEHTVVELDAEQAASEEEDADETDEVDVRWGGSG